MTGPRRRLMWPLDSRGLLDTTKRRGLYTTARNQGLGLVAAARFALTYEGGSR